MNFENALILSCLVLLIATNVALLFSKSESQNKKSIDQIKNDLSNINLANVDGRARLYKRIEELRNIVFLLEKKINELKKSSGRKKS